MQKRQRIRQMKPKRLTQALSLSLAGGIAFAAASVRAQIPPGAAQQLDRVIGERVESVVVLGTQSAAAGGGYGWKLNDADGHIIKIPWKFELAEPRPIGDSGVTWTPVFDGGVGFGSFENHFDNSVLEGNESDFKTTALALGAGPRFYLFDGFSVLPTFDLILGYTENRFFPHTPAGDQLVQAADGVLINWNTLTLTLAPGFEARYRKTFGRWTPEIASNLIYFNTQPLNRSTQAISFKSDSTVWANRFDLDYLTPLELFGCPLHLGGHVGRADLWGGLSQSLGADYYYESGGKITLDLGGKVLKVGNLGVTGGYFWSTAFTGYSFGLDLTLKF